MTLQGDPKGAGGENSRGFRHGQRPEGKTGGAPTESKAGTSQTHENIADVQFI